MGPWHEPGDGTRNHRPSGSVPPGEVVEWLMAPVLKTGEVKASVGSNPTLSVDNKPARVGSETPLGWPDCYWSVFDL